MGPVVWWWRWWLGADPNRDREVAEARGVLDEQRTQVSELTSELDEQRTKVSELTAELEVRDTELATLRTQVADLEAQLRQRVAEPPDLDEAPAQAPDLPKASRPPDLPETPPQPDVSEEAAVPDLTATPDDLTATPDDQTAAPDDLTAVEGIGPKIAGLLREAGIATWRDLAQADVSRLRRVLDDAGPRYRMHDPSAWPSRAALLADGRQQQVENEV